MATFTPSVSIAAKNTTAVNVSKKSKSAFLTPEFWSVAEFNRFGIVPALLTIVVCLSATAAALAVYNGYFQLILVALPTALFLSTIIAVAPMRLIFVFAIITMLIDVSVFFYH